MQGSCHMQIPPGIPKAMQPASVTVPYLHMGVHIRSFHISDPLPITFIRGTAELIFGFSTSQNPLWVVLKHTFYPLCNSFVPLNSASTASSRKVFWNGIRGRNPTLLQRNLVSLRYSDPDTSLLDVAEKAW